jgi:hypothetical protein
MYFSVEKEISMKAQSKLFQYVWSLILRIALLVVMTMPGMQVDTVQAASQEPAPKATNTITLRVIAARDAPNDPAVKQGDNITSKVKYHWLINEDNVGDPTQASAACSAYLPNGSRNPDYPDKCDWPSVRTVPGWAPVYTQGTQADLNESASINISKPGKYLLSLWADGYKIAGQHFSIPMTDPGLVVVQAHPLPLPSATMTIQVFEDKSMTNGQFDVPSEHGLKGFGVVINDTMGQVSNDVYNNPLCTIYQRDTNNNIVFDTNGLPVVDVLGKGCFSDDQGILKVPNLGPMRYDVTVTPPDGTNWTETTTLEGTWSWDTWLNEGSNGLDNEFLIGGEAAPWTFFGFVKPTAALPAASNGGTVKGVVTAALVYTPFTNGLPYQGGLWGGLSGAKLDKPIDKPWIALNDLNNGDTAIYVGRGNSDGSFEIPNVPPGDYNVTYWDDQLFYMLDSVQISVGANQTTDLGVKFLSSWFTEVTGSVFVDDNGNGKRDPSERGIPDMTVVVKDRENTQIDRMTTQAITDHNGNYFIDRLYPLSSWVILEMYNDRYYTTGITYQASNQPKETTIIGSGVDVGVLPIIGQRGRLDWGVKPYAGNENGGIAGTVFYDAMRNEQNAAYSVAEPYSVGIPGLQLNLYATMKDGSGNFIKEADGSYKKGPLLNTYTTETYKRPKDCQARDVNGDPAIEQVLPPSTGGYDCVEGPVTGVQFENGFSEIDGNYAFGSILADPVTGAAIPETAIPAGDYIVEVQVPNDPVFNRPLYEVTKEEDVNVFKGDTYLPQYAPSPCVGPLHTVHVDPAVNPEFAGVGGSVYEGKQMPLCNAKLVTVTNGKSIAPGFFYWTPVPIPGRWKGYIIDDLNLETNPKKLFFGEKAGIANSPIGIYDFSNQLMETIQSDPNGVFEVLLPSSSTYNCPLPQGLCPSVYYIIGNDPGTPDHPNANYSPLYRTIGASFEVYPGRFEPADLAPTTQGVSIQAPGSQQNPEAAKCELPATVPQLFLVDKPYVNGQGTITITGLGFGATQGRGNVTLGDQVLPVVSWSDRVVVVNVPAGFTAGAHQLLVQNDASFLPVNADRNLKMVNGITIHVLGAGYNPPVFEVGPGKTYSTVQAGINAASPVQGLVVVYPGQKTAFTNPRGLYIENVVINKPIKLQGVGPGGVYADNTGVDGSVIDGRAVLGDNPAAQAWRTLVNGMTWSGEQTIQEGQTIYVLAKDGDFTDAFKAQIDGFGLQGGDQLGFPANLNQIFGTKNNTPANVVTQGGAVFVNGYARYLQLTNNVIRANGGAYGTLRFGWANIKDSAAMLANPGKDISVKNHNENVVIAHNRVLANGGTNLAGGLALFAGADNYEVAYNDFCANFSAEYGGGMTHYGYSPNGKIHHNRFYFNRSYDEGGGVMISAELPEKPADLPEGAGPVNVYDNLFQGNLSNDDGGGLRFLMAGNFEFNVYNNTFVNNVSTHEGGGISLNDAPNTRIFNNTIMKNITTATALTSNGLPAPAGLSTSLNSYILQATLPPGSSVCSNAQVFNNLFWDNRAGTWDMANVSGIGQTGDPNPINYWDLGSSDTGCGLSPVNSLLQVYKDSVADPTNIVGQDPQVVLPFDIAVGVLPWRGNPRFVGVNIIATELPSGLMGDFHLTLASPAINAGRASLAGVNAPSNDMDGDARPQGGGFDIGSDEMAAVTPAAGGLVNLSPRLSLNIPAGGFDQPVSLSFTNLAQPADAYEANAAGLPAGTAVYFNVTARNVADNQPASFDPNKMMTLSYTYRFWKYDLASVRPLELGFYTPAAGWAFNPTSRVNQTNQVAYAYTNTLGNFLVGSIGKYSFLPLFIQ